MTKRIDDILTKLQGVLSDDNNALLEELLQAEYNSGFDDGYETGKADYISEDSNPDDDYDDYDEELERGEPVDDVEY